MRIASVVAANGAGHFRRSIGVLHRVVSIRSDAQLVVYCSDRQMQSLGDWWRLRELVDSGVQFVTEIDCGFQWPLVSQDDDLLAWRDRLQSMPGIKSARLVVSDNLAGVLNIRPDAVLMGSFLWSDVLASVKSKNAHRYVADELSLLRAYVPPMLCVDGIVTPGVLRETNAIRLPWMCEVAATEPRFLSGRPRLGICGGTTEAAASEMFYLADLLSRDYDVFVDSALRPETVAQLPGVADGLQREIPITTVDIVLCRPGAGTVMDCVAANIPFLTFHESDSPEMAHSASRLSSLGIASTLGPTPSPEQVLAEVSRLATPDTYNAASARIHALPKDGLGAAAEWLLQKLADQRGPVSAQR